MTIIKKYKILISFLLTIFLLTGCARDLSNTTYTDTSSVNISLTGKVISIRDIKIKESDRPSDTNAGTMIGGASALSLATANDANSGIALGAVVAGSIVGALFYNKLATSKGREFIIKVDRSQLGDSYYEGSKLMRDAISGIKATGVIAVIQIANEDQIQKGDEVIVIISENRFRVIKDISE